MSPPEPLPDSDLAQVSARVPPPRYTHGDGLGTDQVGVEDAVARRMDEIEMLGEEVASGVAPPGHSEVTAGMRYLHCSRTIHQLVTDRNRAVGLFLAVATLMWTASSALLNARPHTHLIVPIESVQYWCMPVTFGTLTLLSLLVAFLLIRTRIGLIYEVAKMNALLGLPPGRVQRVNPLSIFFIMHLMISLAGGGCGSLFALHILLLAGIPHFTLWACVFGLVTTLTLVLLYYGTIQATTSDEKLQHSGRQIQVSQAPPPSVRATPGE